MTAILTGGIISNNGGGGLCHSLPNATIPPGGEVVLEMNHRTPIYDIPPRISLDGIPTEERDSGWVLEIMLGDLDRYIKAFEAALKLFDFAHSQRGATTPAISAGQWKFIAARDGAMSIGYFSSDLVMLPPNDCRIVVWVDENTTPELLEMISAQGESICMIGPGA